MLLVSLPAVLLSTRARRQVRGLTPNKSPLSYSYGHFRTKARGTVSHWLLMVPLADESALTLSEPACNNTYNNIPTLSVSEPFLRPTVSVLAGIVRGPLMPRRATKRCHETLSYCLSNELLLHF